MKKKSIELLLYCKKEKPYLYMPYEFDTFDYDEASKCYLSKDKPILDCDIRLNGSVVAQVKCELVEKMGLDTNKGLLFEGLFNKESQLTLNEIANYVGNNYYYAIHLKKVKPFKIPKKLNYFCYCLDKAPHNMFRCYGKKGNLRILISVSSREACNILNGKQTILVRKSILNVFQEILNYDIRTIR